MKLLEERILKDGEIFGNDVLKVGSFLNHQIDVPFISKLGEELLRLYSGCGVNKILTIEASGIGIACLVAQHFGCPVVFAKKSKSLNVGSDVYSTPVFSFTRKQTYEASVAKELMNENDRILIIDDFLANGSALKALTELVRQSGATLVGAGIMIEKAYQGGGDLLRNEGIRVESLAKIASMSEDGIVFCD